MADQPAALMEIPEEERELRGLELAERHFPKERREQIAQFLEVPADSTALLPYLAWCSSLNLSPISGHVWLIPKKIRAKDAEPERVIYKPAIGRDGLLHKARETKGKPGGFRGLRANVVCEHDVFEVEDDGFNVTILHRFASKPTTFADDVSPDRYRGRVIGAWAICRVDGEAPTFYFANLREHGRLRQVWDYNPSARKRQPIYLDAAGKKTWAEFDGEGMRHRSLQEWEGAWDYLSSMILKAAQSYVLRIALGVTGVVPVDELRDLAAWQRGEEHAAPSIEHAMPEFDFDKIPDDEMRERLRLATERANEQVPFTWPPARCEMAFAGRSAEELGAVAEAIEAENDLRAEKDAAAREAAEQVTDAEVVDDAATRTTDEARRLTDEERKTKVKGLQGRWADLSAAREDAPEDDQAQIGAELDQIEAELRSLGGTLPGESA